MARCVFFSFHLEDSGRADHVLNTDLGNCVDKAEYVAHSEYLEAERDGEAAVRRLIDSTIERTTVTAVLIGHRTAAHKWVQYGIQQSVQQGNGILGIYVHHLKGQPNERTHPLRALYAFFHTDLSGLPPLPSVPSGVHFPVYRWDNDVRRLAREIEAAGVRGDAARNRLRKAKVIPSATLKARR